VGGDELPHVKKLENILKILAGVFICFLEYVKYGTICYIFYPITKPLTGTLRAPEQNDIPFCKAVQRCPVDSQNTL